MFATSALKITKSLNPADASVRAKLDLHLRKVKSHKDLKDGYVAKARADNTDVLCIEFDYGQNILLPKLSVNAQYYRRLMHFNIFKVHCHNDSASIMYCYPECSCKKNPDSVASCLYNFISRLFAEKKYGEIVFLSDNAGGQNKNITIVRFSTFLSVHFQVKVTHIFPIRGHSYGQCDRNFGVYSKKMKKVEIIATGAKAMEIIKNSFEVDDCQGIMKKWGESLSPFMLTKPTSKGAKFAIQSYQRISYSKGNVMAASTYQWAMTPFTFLKKGMNHFVNPVTPA